MKIPTESQITAPKYNQYLKEAESKNLEFFTKEKIHLTRRLTYQKDTYLNRVDNGGKGIYLDQFITADMIIDTLQNLEACTYFLDSFEK